MPDLPPIVLVFAATDPSGGAGVQADIMTLSSMGCHPLSCVTAITVQDTMGVEDLYPLDPEWPARAQRLHRIGARWGLFPSDQSPAEFPWTAALRAGERADAATMAPYLPAEIDRVYLQADLTAIAPGPLAPALDLRLRSMALRESRAQASTYRFTADSIAAGMTEGETAVHDFRPKTEGTQPVTGTVERGDAPFAGATVMLTGGTAGLRLATSDDKRADAHRATKAIFQQFETWIREHPEQWRWWNIRPVRAPPRQDTEPFRERQLVSG